MHNNTALNLTFEESNRIDLFRTESEHPEITSKIQGKSNTMKNKEDEIEIVPQ
jgi:hypothetical protein